MGWTIPMTAETYETFISQAVPLLFDFDFPIFDEAYRIALERKIIENLWDYEIGVTPYARWKLLFMRKLRNIMPYYNQLYKSAMLEFDPLITEDYERNYTKNYNRDNSGTSTMDTTTENTSSTEQSGNASTTTGASNTENNRSRFSNTPSGIVQQVEDGTYLTTYQFDTNDNVEQGSSESETSSSSTDTFDSKANSSNQVSNLEQYLENYGEKIKGKRGTQSYASLIKEWRETFLNIDMMVINELKQTMLLVY